MKINSVNYYFKTKQIPFLLQMDFLDVLLNLKILFSNSVRTLNNSLVNIHTLPSTKFALRVHFSLSFLG